MLHHKWEGVQMTQQSEEREKTNHLKQLSCTVEPTSSHVWYLKNKEEPKAQDVEPQSEPGANSSLCYWIAELNAEFKSYGSAGAAESDANDKKAGENSLE